MAGRAVDKVLTIAVPSYNTQDYIDTCLPTMLQHPYTAQTEILLVNDGSTDGTLEKMRWYEQNYPDTVVVIDKQNAGHGSAVNIAVEKARGTYFKVIDGDDWVLAENLGKMVRQLAHCKADLVVHPYIKYNVSKKRSRIIRYKIEKNKLLNFDQAAPRLKEAAIHAATYRTELLRGHQIRVRENCFYEDTEYNIYPIPFVNTVFACSYPVYVYRTGTLSQSIHPKQAFQNRKMHSRIIGDCIAYYEKYEDELSEEKKDYIRRIIGRRIRSQYMIYLKNPMTASRMWELMKWDCRLRETSISFYEYTNRLPVWLLRKNPHRTYPILKLLYRFYTGMK